MLRKFDPKEFNSIEITDLDLKSRIYADYKLFALGFNDNRSLKEKFGYGNGWIWEYIRRELPNRSILSGPQAFEEYKKQWPTDLIYIDDAGPETSTISTITIGKDEGLPDISMFQSGDYTIAHKNFKWALVRTHEESQLGPYFITKK